MTKKNFALDFFETEFAPGCVYYWPLSFGWAEVVLNYGTIFDSFKELIEEYKTWPDDCDSDSDSENETQDSHFF